MISNAYTHTKDCPDRKAAAADRKAHDTLAKARELQLQLIAHAEWFDAGPTHAPSYNPDYQGDLLPNQTQTDPSAAARDGVQMSPAVHELWASPPTAA